MKFDSFLFVLLSSLYQLLFITTTQAIILNMKLIHFFYVVITCDDKCEKKNRFSIVTITTQWLDMDEGLKHQLHRHLMSVMVIIQ